jgi:hypothetical protein
MFQGGLIELTLIFGLKTLVKEKMHVFVLISSTVAGMLKICFDDDLRDCFDQDENHIIFF